MSKTEWIISILRCVEQASHICAVRHLCILFNLNLHWPLLLRYYREISPITFRLYFRKDLRIWPTAFFRYDQEEKVWAQFKCPYRQNFILSKFGDSLEFFIVPIWLLPDYYLFESQLYSHFEYIQSVCI